ncbi:MULTISPECIES: hypothetical protein [Variovorax]|jgi:hypothetical protein|uniref:hypothetical protein n=1 Tax=Variovorax TaxID=34072 RepID=UPI001F20375F|nr:MULTISPECIES: hypothetical protein [Variovorax]UKI05679.1 hypothetical protein L3V85_22965 [Variovorax paradoxus]
MINSVSEFMALCDSRDESGIARSLRDEAPFGVWEELILNFQSRKIDVAQNITISVAVMGFSHSWGRDCAINFGGKKKFAIRYFQVAVERF